MAIFMLKGLAIMGLIGLIVASFWASLRRDALRTQADKVAAKAKNLAGRVRESFRPEVRRTVLTPERRIKHVKHGIGYGVPDREWVETIPERALVVIDRGPLAEAWSHFCKLL